MSTYFILVYIFYRQRGRYCLENLESRKPPLTNLKCAEDSSRHGGTKVEKEYPVKS